MKRRCRAMRRFRDEILECDRGHDHGGRHRCRWREGRGVRFVDVIVRWR